MNHFELKQIAAQFEFGGPLVDARPCNNGHINDTYILIIQSAGGGTRRYILQRINHHVFKSPEAVMRNIQLVTEHLRHKVVQADGDPAREVVNLVPTVDGGYLYKSPRGEYWRAYLFVEGAKTYEAVQNPKHFCSAGEAFGHFQSLLSDFPAGTLTETIPKFHDTPSRFVNLMEAARQDRANRSHDARDDIRFAEERAADTAVIVELLEQDQLPTRVTHNDTKLNNVMIDDVTGKGVCVLDLDTVMPGSTLYDFGDAIRFGASATAEDERDLSLVRIDLELYRQFARGYLSHAGDFLTTREIELLPFSAKLITLELGMRFLSDHLNGDVYFRIHRPGHNLDRARAQFRLAFDMEQRMDEMREILEQESSVVA